MNRIVENKQKEGERIMISLDERGKQCPIPIVDTKKAVEPLRVGEVVETVVDKEISAPDFSSSRRSSSDSEPSQVSRAPPL